jgi:thiamine transport system substrate-binding protein
MPTQGDYSNPCPISQEKGTTVQLASRKNVIIWTTTIATVLLGLSIYQSTNKMPHSVTLATHDSFVMTKSQIADFEQTTGFDLTLVRAGDAGSLTNRLILTKSAPIADVVFGIDNTFAGRATDADIIDGKLSPTDFGDVCMNYDKLWFAHHGISAPHTVNDLVKPLYKNLAVVENPNTSSTGLAFLAATIDKFGVNGWQTYWKQLKSNGVKVTDGWETAYYTEFSGYSGKGEYPIVLSYAASPADEIDGDGSSRTAVIDDGCFRQTEYVGVLAGAKNPQGAQAVIDYLLSPTFQATFPTAMYMYPYVPGTVIPAAWRNNTSVASHTYGDQLDITANRKEWLKTWSAIFE